MSLQETRINFLRTIDERVRVIDRNPLFEEQAMSQLNPHANRVKSEDREALVELVREETCLHQAGLIRTMTPKNILGELLGIHEDTARGYLGKDLTPKELAYRRLHLHREGSKKGTERLNSLATSEFGREAMRARWGGEGGSLLDEMVLPLVVRGFSNQSIEALSGLDNKQVRNARYRIRKNPNTPQSISETNKRKPAAESNDPRQQFNQHFLGELFKLKFFGSDLRIWDQLGLIGDMPNQEQLFTQLDRLRHEAFMRARSLAVTGKASLLARYKQVGSKINPQLFNNTLVDDEIYFRHVARCMSNGF